MELQLLRHATLVIRGADRSILVDPMLSQVGAMEPVANAGNDQRIPMTPLPLEDEVLSRLLAELDGLLVTHLHRDHWDQAAHSRLRHDLPLACQPVDAESIRATGFTDVTPVDERVSWLGWELIRTSGEHGRGAVGERMGPVSGFVLRADGQPTLYVAGDTVWCPAVESVLANERPDVVVVNAGGAQFLEGGPITMDIPDVLAMLHAAPWAHVVAVHFETVNHCRLSRNALRQAVDSAGVNDRVSIPADGETLHFVSEAIGQY